MRRAVWLLALASVIAPALPAVDLEGRRLFVQKCAMCHGPSGMGTGLLARRMRPEVAQLEKREDLSAAYVERAARLGILNMPPITRGDVTDEQLGAIAKYLAKANP